MNYSKSSIEKCSLFVLLMMFLFDVSGQQPHSKTEKGSFYAYWGYNRSAYTKSDLNLVGRGYDFTMSNLQASDNPEKFNPNVYFNPKK
ncbi:MAG: hypothetical protein WEA99_12140 [Brumimicrobium sp.]